MASAVTRGASNHATKRRVSALALVAIALAGGPAAAQSDERPVLVLDATATEAGARMVARIEKHLGPDPALAPVAERFRQPLRAPTPTDTSWQVERETLVEAQKLLTPVGYRQAAMLARSAQDRLARLAGEPEVRALLADLVLVEGLAVAGETGPAAARPLFMLVHRLSPGRTLDPGRFLPHVVRAFEEAAVTGVTGRLEIKASGAAEVLVDGVVVPGGEPVNLAVPAGPHIITVRGEAILAEGRRVEAVARNQVLVELTPVLAPLEVRLGRARDRLVAATDDRARIDAVTTLLGLTRSARDAIVVVRDEDGALAVRLYTDRGGLGPSRPVDDDVAAAVAPLRPVVRPPPRGGGPRPGGGVVGPPPPPPRPWWQEPWVKAAGGTVAGVVAVAVLTAIITRDPGTSTLDPGLEVE